MHAQRLVSGLAVAALGLAGCGGGSSSSHRAARTSTPVGAPLHTFKVTLTGRAAVPPGAPNASGIAIVAIHSSTVVCWRFAHLHGFVNATVAHIHRGRAGQAGNVLIPLSTGARLHHRGCTTASVAAIAAIQRDPTGYYVNVHSVKYPAGAVRGQL